MRTPRRRGGNATIVVAAMAISIFCWSRLERLHLPHRLSDKTAGSAQLVSFAEVRDFCRWEPASVTSGPLSGLKEINLFAAFPGSSVEAATLAGDTTDVTRPPVRKIWDSDPVFTGIAVDTRRDEVFLQDANTWSIRVFNRTDNTPANAVRTEPKRVIIGPKTGIQYNSGLYVDPQNGDLHSIENDTGDSIAVYPGDADGDVPAKRRLEVTHYAYVMAVDEEKQEIFLSVHAPPQIEVYRKSASGKEKPIRVLHGNNTRLADVHGVALDTKNKLLFVNSWGDFSDYTITGSGSFDPPSIAIFPIDADGDTPPLRVILGPKTTLNWPGAMSVDPATGDLYVANNVAQSVVVFHGTDKGDVAPARVIKGNKTGLNHPFALEVDAKNRELWVSNIGNASATVYPIAANGNVEPVRTIRSAPKVKLSLRFGKAVSVAYDSKREEILVPN